MRKLYPILKIIRPQQWIKNSFVFLPMFFSGTLTDADKIMASIITFFAYSFIASSVYCFNDIIDVEADRRHAVKCNRPIASGKVTVKEGYLLMFLMLALAVGITILLGDRMLAVGAVLLIYYVMNMGYCAKFKQYAIVDVCIVAFGFVLRIFAGGQATDVMLSKWLVLMTFLLTLFLSFAKRRDDVLRMNQTGEPPRKNTIRYNLTFINQAITITAAVTLVCYIMYTISPDVIASANTDYLYLTSIFVVVGLMRYIQLTVVDEKSGDPTKVILRDRFMQLAVIGWLLSFLFIIYIM